MAIETGENIAQVSMQEEIDEGEDLD